MKFLSMIAFTLMLFSSQAQLAIFPQASTGCGNYIEQAGIYFNENPLFDEMKASGNRLLNLNEKGTFTVRTLQMVGNELRSNENISFVLAILDERTGTQRIIRLDETSEVSMEELKRFIDIGDSIIFMTVNEKYALPNHKVQFDWGC